MTITSKHVLRSVDYSHWTFGGHFEAHGDFPRAELLYLCSKRLVLNDKRDKPRQDSTARGTTVMTRLRRILMAFTGLTLVALALMGALYYGANSGGLGNSWPTLNNSERYTGSHSAELSSTGQGIRPADQVQSIEPLHQNFKATSSEDGRSGESGEPAQDGDQSSLLQVSREQTTLDTMGGGGDEKSDSSPPQVGVDYGAKTVTDGGIGKSPILTGSLSRLASTLSFDYSSCPKDSLVHTSPPGATFTPKHPDCPSLFIIGARKGGTTSLIQYLSKHPHFVGAKLGSKAQAGETMYYTSLYNRRNWKDYMGFFPPPEPGVLTGESSVAYATRCPVPRRIVEDCGTKPKIVYLIRNPYQRFESNYLMRLRFHSNYPNINEVFQQQWNLLIKALNGSMNMAGEIGEGTSLYRDFSCKWEKGTPNMLYDSLYFTFLSHWLCNYPSPENIMIVNSEEFFEKPGRILNQIFAFLGLSELTEQDLNAIVSSVYNQGKHRDVVVTTENRKLLEKLYTPFTKEILTLLKWDVDWSM